MGVSGTYDVVINAPVGERKASLTLSEESGELRGSMTGEDGYTDDILEPTRDGDKLSWKAKIKKPMQLTLEFSGEYKDPTIEGSVQLGPLGRAPFRAVPQS